MVVKKIMIERDSTEKEVKIRERQRETETERERETDRQRERKREREVRERGLRSGGDLKTFKGQKFQELFPCDNQSKLESSQASDVRVKGRATGIDQCCLLAPKV